MTKYLTIASGALAVLLTIGIAGLVVLRLTVVGYYRIPQDGMYPTMPGKTRVVGQRQAYKAIDDVERGDVVAYLWEKDGTRYRMIWRVVGLPGDALQFEGEEMVVNGKSLLHETVRNEGHYRVVRERAGSAAYEIAFDTSVPEDERPAGETVVPEGHLFVVGDNRFHAADSREYGPVPFASVTDKVIYWFRLPV